MAKVTLLGDFSHVPDLPFGHNWSGDKKLPSQGALKDELNLPDNLSEFRLYGLNDLGKFKPVTWLIPKRLAVGESHVLWGKGDSFKSFLALHWSMTLAYSGAIVIYVVAEGASGLVARTHAWQRANGWEVDAPGMLFVPRGVNLHERRAVDTWIEAMRVQLGEWYSDRPESQRHPVLVVFDTLARNFVGGDEVSPRDMGLFVEGVERVRRGLGCATLVIHHSDKAGGSERGTESLRNSCFAMFRMDRVAVSATGSGFAAKLTCDRIKDFGRPEPQVVEFELIETDLEVDGSAVSSLACRANEKVGFPGKTARKGAPEVSDKQSADLSEMNGRVHILSSNERKVLEFFDGEGKVPSRPWSVSALSRKLKLTREPTRHACKQLSDMGILGVSGKTKARLYWLQQEVEL